MAPPPSIAFIIGRPLDRLIVVVSVPSSYASTHCFEIASSARTRSRIGRCRRSHRSSFSKERRPFVLKLLRNLSARDQKSETKSILVAASSPITRVRRSRYCCKARFAPDSLMSPMPMNEHQSVLAQFLDRCRSHFGQKRAHRAMSP